MRAIKKLITFLIMVTFIPKYSFSTGAVRMPTIIKVVVKAAKTIYATPFSNKIALSG
jgi:hypothetical protein